MSQESNKVFPGRVIAAKAGRWIREIRMRKLQYQFLRSPEVPEICEYLEGRNLSVLKDAGGIEM